MTISVLHVCRTYYPDPPGGIQEAIRQIALSTAGFGIASKVFTMSQTASIHTLRLPEATIYRASSLAAPFSCDIGGVDAFRQFSTLAREVDIVHYHFPWPFADLLNFVKHSNTPAVMTYHSDIVRQHWLEFAYGPLKRRTLGKMDAIVSTSPSYASGSSTLSNSKLAGKLRCIPLGIGESSYVTNGDESILEHLGLLDGVPFFLFIGVPRYYKGLHNLVRAASLVNAKIVIAGSGAKEKIYWSQARRQGANNILFCGRVSDAEKVALLRNCKALVLPSHLRSEAFGMVLVEASLLGKSMVSCEIGTGTSYINKNNETGFVVPPESPDALAEAMNRLLVDDELASRFGRNARERYEALFSGDVLGKAYSDLYREVLNK